MLNIELYFHVNHLNILDIKHGRINMKTRTGLPLLPSGKRRLKNRSHKAKLKPNKARLSTPDRPESKSLF